MRPVIFSSIVHYTHVSRASHWRPESMTVDTARSRVRRARRNADAVCIYETTDRDGNGVHVVHVHFGPGFWDNAHFVTDIYEIPTAALLAL